MHILFISRGYPSAQRPQNGNFEVDQAEGLVKLGHKVSMISVDLGREFIPKEFGIQRIQKNGVLSYHCFFIPMKFFPGEGIFRKLLNMQLDYLYQKVVQEAGKPDIIYAHYLWNSDWALFFKNKYHIPLVGIEHWSEFGYDEIKPIIEKNARRIYPQLDKLIVVSHTLQRKIQERFGIKADVVFNTIHDMVKVLPAPPRTDDIVRFITTGTLLPVKGYDNLITAFAQCPLSRDKWNLTIIGEGPEEKTLKQLIIQHNLENNIRLAGRKKKDEVVEALNQSDVFISSSHLETFGVAALEAICCGIPVLATDSGGPREFITKKNGILCDDNIEALQQGIEYMFHHYKDYDRKAIADDCRARFSSEVIAKQLTAIFEDVVAKHKQR